MKTAFSWLGALLLVVAANSVARAQSPYFPQQQGPVRIAPDACHGGGYYCTGCYGMVYGPNYCLRPAFQPFNGMLPSMQSTNSGAQFAGHVYARSPRDYFMVD
jgi:hypothetical protein